MNFLSMQTDVKAYSGEQNSTRVKAAINNQYRLILNKLKWPQNLVQPVTPIVLVANTQAYDLESGFKWMNKVWVTNPNDGEPIYLGQKRHILNNVNQGTSQFYRVYVSAKGTGATRPKWKIALGEIPNSSFVSRYTSLQYEYYYQPDDLSANTDVPHVDLGGDQVIVYGASILLNAKQNDTQGFKMIGSMYTDGLADMIQRAIEVWGDDILVPPGIDITEHEGKILNDYGVQKFGSN